MREFVLEFVTKCKISKFNYFISILKGQISNEQLRDVKILIFQIFYKYLYKKSLLSTLLSTSLSQTKKIYKKRKSLLSIKSIQLIPSVQTDNIPKNKPKRTSRLIVW